MSTPDPWVCGYCEKRYPIPVMARDCEARHEEDDDGG